MMPSESTWDPSCLAHCETQKPTALVGFFFVLECWLA